MRNTIKLLFYRLLALGSYGLVLSSLSWVPTANAGLGIVPEHIQGEPIRSWFVYTLSPGDIQEDIAVISNTSDKAITVAVEGLDAINTAGGGFTLIPSSSDNKDLGTWVTLENTTVQIPANQSKSVKFKITVPKNASAGQHSGAVVAYEKSDTVSGGVGMRIRIGARIYVTVPGRVVRKMTFDKVTHTIKDGKLTFEVTAQNKSNINIEPALDISLAGLRVVRQTVDDNGQFLPNSKIDFKVDWKRPAPKVGYYRANFVLHTWSVEEILEDGTKHQLPDMTFRYSYSFWVGGKYMAIIAGLLVLSWIIFRIAIYLRDRIKYRTKVDTYTVKKGETIMHISESTGVLPQALVKFNRLVWPYALNAGDTIMVPSRYLTPDELYAKQEHEAMPAIWWYLLSPRTSLYHPTLAKLTPTKNDLPKSRIKVRPKISRRK